VGKEILRYGPEKGPSRFVTALTTFLNESVGYKTDKEDQKVNPDHLMATSGCSQAISWICRQFTVPGDVIFVEEASYFLALEIFRKDYKLKTIAIKQDEEGLILDHNIEEMCTQHKPKFIYTIPTHSNPTGKTLPTQRRQELIRICQKYKLLILADEVYQLINFKGYVPPPSMVALDTVEDSCVIGIGSFSKIFGPGLRIGWIHTKNSEHLKSIAYSGELVSGGNGNVGPQIATSIINLGLQKKQLELYNKIYEERTTAGINGLQKYFGVNSKYPLKIGKVQGGYFVWVELPKGNSSKELLQKCAQHKVGFAPGTVSSADGGLDNFVRFCFVFYTLSEIEEGLIRLGKALLD